MDGTPIIIKKKKHEEHGHHGGSWKVAYADFVTAMMAFFMVMWIMGLSDQTRAQISGYFNDPLGYSKVEPRSENIANISKQMQPPAGKKGAKSTGSSAYSDGKKQKLKELQEKVEQLVLGDPKFAELGSHIEVTLTNEGLRIELVESAGSVFFDSGKATLKPAAQDLIRALAAKLGASGDQLVIEGHTDSQRFTTPGYDNWDLSQDRAHSLAKALENGGIDPEKQFREIRGYGDKKLKNTKNPLAPENRRVSILIPLDQITDSGSGDDAEFSAEPKVGEIRPAYDLGADKRPRIDITQNRPVSN